MDCGLLGCALATDQISRGIEGCVVRRTIIHAVLRPSGRQRVRARRQKEANLHVCPRGRAKPIECSQLFHDISLNNLQKG